MPLLPTVSLLSYLSPSVSNSLVDTVPVYPNICEQYTLSTYLLIYCSSTVTPVRSSELSSIAATVSSDTSLAIVKEMYLLYELADIYLLKLTIISAWSTEKPAASTIYPCDLRKLTVDERTVA